MASLRVCLLPASWNHLLLLCSYLIACFQDSQLFVMAFQAFLGVILSNIQHCVSQLGSSHGWTPYTCDEIFQALPVFCTRSTQQETGEEPGNEANDIHKLTTSNWFTYSVLVQNQHLVLYMYMCCNCVCTVLHVASDMMLPILFSSGRSGTGTTGWLVSGLIWDHWWWAVAVTNGSHPQLHIASSSPDDKALTTLEMGISHAAV